MRGLSAKEFIRIFGTEFPASARVLAAEDLDLPQPQLRGATVKFDFDVVQEPGSIPKFMVDRDTVRLELPPVPAAEAQELPDRFALVLDSPVEDTYGRAGMLRFKFAVSVTGREPKPDGQVELKFDASTEEIRDVSRA